MTRYVLGDLRQAHDELTRRAAELTAWLDRVAAGYQASNLASPDLALGDLFCVQAVSSTAARLTAAAESIAACVGDVAAADRAVADRMRGWPR